MERWKNFGSNRDWFNTVPYSLVIEEALMMPIIMWCDLTQHGHNSTLIFRLTNTPMEEYFNGRIALKLFQDIAIEVIRKHSWLKKRDYGILLQNVRIRRSWEVYLICLTNQGKLG